MTKLQWAAIAAALALFLVLYFGCDRRPTDVASMERSRALSMEQVNPEVLIQQAKAELGPSEQALTQRMEQAVEAAPSDEERAEAYKRLSSQWYELQQPAIAGYYAQQVAELLNEEESWSISGTTYTICVQRSEDEEVRDFCTGRALQAFEMAISLAPENAAHRVNLALVYTANPPEDNPMKGILMLRELNQEDPDNVLVLNALGRLAIRTGQFDKALERLEAALLTEPDNRTTICLLAQAYDGAGDAIKAKAFADQCKAQAQ